MLTLQTLNCISVKLHCKLAARTMHFCPRVSVSPSHLLGSAGHRVLLFSQMTRALDMVEDFLQLRSFNFLRLDGKTKSDARCT